MYSFKKLGYDNYQEYLDSPLWARIRKRVFVKYGGKCAVCKKKAQQVHHRSYALKVMKGSDIEPLIALCTKHHHEIEFITVGKKKGQKRKKGKVNKILDRLLKNETKKKKNKKPKQKVKGSKKSERKKRNKREIKEKRRVGKEKRKIERAIKKEQEEKRRAERIERGKTVSKRLREVKERMADIHFSKYL